MLRRTHHCFGALAISLALAAAAQGQAPQVDPDSPAGTEYQLPLDRARSEASGAAAESPLFGEGVDETKPPANVDERQSGRDSDPATVRDVQTDSGAASSEELQAQVPSPDGGGGGLAAIAAGAGGVLLLGGLAGLAWRRRSG